MPYEETERVPGKVLAFARNIGFDREARKFPARFGSVDLYDIMQAAGITSADASMAARNRTGRGLRFNLDYLDKWPTIKEEPQIPATSYVINLCLPDVDGIEDRYPGTEIIDLGRLSRKRMDDELDMAVVEHFRNYRDFIGRMMNFHLDDGDINKYDPPALMRYINKELTQLAAQITMGREAERDGTIRKLRTFTHGTPYKAPLNHVISLMRTSEDHPQKSRIIKMLLEQIVYIAHEDEVEAKKVAAEIKRISQGI